MKAQMIDTDQNCGITENLLQSIVIKEPNKTTKKIVSRLSWALTP